MRQMVHGSRAIACPTASPVTATLPDCRGAPDERRQLRIEARRVLPEGCVADAVVEREAGPGNHAGDVARALCRQDLVLEAEGHEHRQLEPAEERIGVEL